MEVKFSESFISRFYLHIWERGFSILPSVKVLIQKKKNTHTHTFKWEKNRREAKLPTLKKKKTEQETLGDDFLGS